MRRSTSVRATLAAAAAASQVSTRSMRKQAQQRSHEQAGACSISGGGQRTCGLPCFRTPNRKPLHAAAQLRLQFEQASWSNSDGRAITGGGYPPEKKQKDAPLRVGSRSDRRAQSQTSSTAAAGRASRRRAGRKSVRSNKAPGRDRELAGVPPRRRERLHASRSVEQGAKSNRRQEDAWRAAVQLREDCRMCTAAQKLSLAANAAPACRVRAAAGAAALIEGCGTGGRAQKERKLSLPAAEEEAPPRERASGD